MEEGSVLSLTGAGNTDYLAQRILLDKGYELILDNHHPVPTKLSEIYPPAEEECVAVALKSGRKFFGENFIEILGLVTIWEARGVNWQLKDGEYVDLRFRYRTFDSDGNLLEDVPAKSAGL